MDSQDLNPYRSPESPPESLRESPFESAAGDPPAADDGDRLVQAASFVNVSEAQLCQALLEQHGIRAELADEATVGVNLLWSNAIGGVKVLVMLKDAEQAAQVLAEGRQQPQSPEELEDITFECEECTAEITFPGSRRGHVETCPKCHEYVDVPD